MQRGPYTETTYFIVYAVRMSKPLHTIYYEGESNENSRRKRKIEILLRAAVGTASHQRGLEACTVYGDRTVCSCRHSKAST